MKSKILVSLLVVLAIVFTATSLYAEEAVKCKLIWRNQAVTPGGYVESQPIALSSHVRGSAVWKVKSGGILSLQPSITEGTFTFTVYFSNFPDASVWDSGTDIATGLTSADTNRISIDPKGVALWMKIKATETGGSGNPSLSAVLCSN